MQNDQTSKTPIEGAFNPAELANCQAGCVVSREILKRSTGSVTVFAFDQDQALSEHTAPFDALVHVIEGEAEITLKGKPHRVAAGQMLLMPANQPHALKAVEPFKMVLTMIKTK